VKETRPRVAVAAQSEASPWTLAWLDARTAVIVRCASDGAIAVDELESDVPAHHRATGHVRRSAAGSAPAEPPRSAGETHRLEHLRRWIEAIAEHLSPADDLAIYGPGVVARQLVGLINERDQHHRRERTVMHGRRARMSQAQLIAEVRQLAGHAPARGRLGRHRWSGAQPPPSAPHRRPSRRQVIDQALAGWDDGRAALEPDDSIRLAPG
jgi:hypothetical protein